MYKVKRFYFSTFLLHVQYMHMNALVVAYTMSLTRLLTGMTCLNRETGFFDDISLGL